MLNSMGARISVVASNLLTIEGVDTPVVVKETGNTGDDQEIKDLIAKTIDWKYDFKAKETALEANSKWKKDAATDGVVWTLTIPSAGGENQDDAGQGAG